MKITTLSTLLSVLSLAAVAVLAIKVDELGDELRLARSTRAEVSRKALEQDRDMSYRDTSYRTARRDELSGEDSTVAGSPGDRDGAAAVDSAPPATVEERLARLERNAKRGRTLPVPMFRGRKFVRNVDDLGDHLDLTRSQRDRVNDTIRRGKERIDAILSVPGSDGKSPKQAREERDKKIQEVLASPEKDHSKIIGLAMSGRQKLKEKVPGSNETYAEQIKRVKQETREEVNAGLSPEQQEGFKDTNIDGMLGGGGGAQMSFVATTTMGDGTGDGPAGGIIVESAEDVSIDIAVEDE